MEQVLSTTLSRTTLSRESRQYATQHVTGQVGDHGC